MGQYVQSGSSPSSQQGVMAGDSAHLLMGHSLGTQLGTGSTRRWGGDSRQQAQVKTGRGWVTGVAGGTQESQGSCVDQEDVREGQGSHRWLWMRVLLGIRPGSVPRRQEGRSQPGYLTKPACYALRDGSVLPL